jgi:hypothetical protein
MTVEEANRVHNKPAATLVWEDDEPDVYPQLGDVHAEAKTVDGRYVITEVDTANGRKFPVGWCSNATTMTRDETAHSTAEGVISCES